jgi:hypothetical protein
MEVQAAAAGRRIIERLADRIEVGEAARKRVDGRCRARRRKLVLHRGVAFEHPVPSFIVRLMRPRISAAGAFLMGGECGTKTA